jgi:8-oxo-dGTP pyrophosphatase MutT (NUDIX family)
MSHAEVVARLRAGLAGRPGARLQLAAHRASAVAVPLLERDGATHLVLTLRTPHLRAHSGQVSFPGGACDAGEALATTARRECFEELGLPPEHLAELGVLDDVPTPSGFIITPVVCELGGGPPLYRPNPAEVAEVFEAPLAAFADPAQAEDLGERVYLGVTYRMRAYHVAGHRVWGATARIVEQLVAVLGRAA